MKLRLVLKGPDRLMGAQIEKTMESGSIVIGRSPNADWTLPDPEKVVSKTHCRIDRDFSGFMLTDTSTNGVMVNDEPVGFGLPRQLADRDVLQLGDAVIFVRIEEEAPRPAPQQKPVAPAVAAARPMIPDGPFTLPEESPGARPVAASPAMPGNRQVEKILDDWWSPAKPPETGPNSVDISSKEERGGIDDTIMHRDSLPSPDGGVGEFAVSLAGIDLATFAKAVGAAVAVLPESEKYKFHERLRDLLDQARPHGKM